MKPYIRQYHLHREQQNKEDIMGIFSRFKDIINSNLNSMLDNAEHPEKMIRLIIREMEDTLIELKAACAGVMAEKKKIFRKLEEVEGKIEHWTNNAKLAVEKGKDELAREAIMEKQRFTRHRESLEKELQEMGALILQYQEDIAQLEDKLKSAREKQRVLAQRHIHAQRRKTAQEDIRKMDSTETIIRFDEYENKIERMEAEADLVNFAAKPSLEEEFEKLTRDEEIEKELNSIKAEVGKKDQ